MMIAALFAAAAVSATCDLEKPSGAPDCTRANSIIPTAATSAPTVISPRGPTRALARPAMGESTSMSTFAGVSAAPARRAL